jgi:hypothetical protein
LSRTLRSASRSTPRTAHLTSIGRSRTWITSTFLPATSVWRTWTSSNWPLEYIAWMARCTSR